MPLETSKQTQAILGVALLGLGTEAVGSLFFRRGFLKNPKSSYLLAALIVSAGIAFMAKSLED